MSGASGSTHRRRVTPSGVVACAQQRDRAVDAAAHRDRDARGARSSSKHRTERRRQRLDDELLAVHGRSLEHRQPGEVFREPVRIRIDDAIPAHTKSHGGPVAVAGGVAEELGHAPRLENACAMRRRIDVLPRDLAVLEREDVDTVPLETLARLLAGRGGRPFAHDETVSRVEAARRRT